MERTTVGDYVLFDWHNDLYRMHVITGVTWKLAVGKQRWVRVVAE